jgi:hypothetical protein
MYNVTFGVHKSRKVDLLRRIFSGLSSCGLRVFDESIGADGKHVFCLADKGLWRILREACGTSAHTKHLPQMMLHYPLEFLDSSLAILKATDGTFDDRKGRTCWSYSTSSPVLADQVQQMCIHAGHRAAICETPASGKRRTNYRVLIVPDKPEQLVSQSDISVEEYDGNVYCFNVPNHLFFTRRNGKVAIHGNTADTSRDIADEQVFAPDRDEDDEQFNRFVIVGGWDAVYHTLKSLNPNITDDSELIKLMNMAEKSGGMTPRRADRIVRDVFGQNIGPMPKGIDLDIPFTIQFAQAQQGNPAGSTQKAIEQLVGLSERVDDELSKRWEDGHEAPESD